MMRAQSCVGRVGSFLRNAPTLSRRTASTKPKCRGQECLAHAEPFEGSPLHDDMIEALKAVRLASTACMAVQRTLATTNINTKDDDSPVTVAGVAHDHHMHSLMWSLHASFGSQRRANVVQTTLHRLWLHGPCSEHALTGSLPLPSDVPLSCHIWGHLHGKAGHQARSAVSEKVYHLCRLKLVAEEDSAELRDPAQSGMLQDVCDVFNTTLADALTDAPQMSTQEVCDLIDLGDSQGGPGQHWVLDPIDGTRGFEAARQYSVCLGMIQDGEPVLGVRTLSAFPLK